MAIQISRREVLNNIIRLKDKLLERKEEEKRRAQERREYNAILNRQTGDLRFIEENARFQPADGWIEIRIDVIETQKNEPARFEATDNQNQPLEPRGLEPLAWRIFAETLETLNLMASQNLPKSHDVLPEEAALEDLSEIHLAEIAGNIEEMSGWYGDIDRFEAEKRLQRKEPGTYLLREGGHLSQPIAQNLGEANKMSVKPYLITMKDIDKKVVDKLMLQTDRGWTLYRDNPDLNDSEYVYYNSPQEAFAKTKTWRENPNLTALPFNALGQKEDEHSAA